MPRHAAPFWSRVDRSTDCWLWLGAKNDDGYGIVGHVGKAHRVAWELTNGKIPADQHVLHRCDNPGCVRPDHLFLGSNHDNVLDRHSKGRSANLFPAGDAHPARLRRGSPHWAAKLSDEAVREIRERREQGSTTVDLGRAFNVHPATISRIARRKWRGEVP